MSELRAPDPTLTALAATDAGDTDLMLAHYDEEGVPVAHLVQRDAWVVVCGVSEDVATHWSVAEYARWFAVPCRECFPDAPEPGHEFYTLIQQDNSRAIRQRPVSVLSWQVGGVTCEARSVPL